MVAITVLIGASVWLVVTATVSTQMALAEGGGGGGRAGALAGPVSTSRHSRASRRGRGEEERIASTPDGRASAPAPVAGPPVMRGPSAGVGAARRAVWKVEEGGEASRKGQGRAATGGPSREGRPNLARGILRGGSRVVKQATAGQPPWPASARPPRARSSPARSPAPAPAAWPRR